MIFRVADEEGVVGVDPDTMGAVEAGGERRIAVGAVGGLAGADEGGDDLRARVDGADGVVLGVDEINAAVSAEREALRAVERGELRGAAVAGETFLARAGDVASGADDPGALGSKASCACAMSASRRSCRTFAAAGSRRVSGRHSTSRSMAREVFRARARIGSAARQLFRGCVENVRQIQFPGARHVRLVVGTRPGWTGGCQPGGAD